MVSPLLKSYVSTTVEHCKRVAIVGGPKAGKSTLLKHLEYRYGKRIAIVDETATRFFASELTKPPSYFALNPWLIRLQPAILHTQILREHDAIEKARYDTTEIIFFDRGTADIAAYLPNKEAQMEELFPGLTLAALHSQYDLVIHLESVVMSNPDAFDSAENVTRYEERQQAVKLELATQNAWKTHPAFHFIAGAGGIESVIAQAMAIISPLLDVEHERRWILPNAQSLGLSDYVGMDIQQAYVLRAPIEKRLRRQADRTILTYKQGSGVTRFEREYDLPEDIFQAEWAQITSQVIEKTRFKLSDGMELDIHQGHLAGLIKLEKSFRTSAEAAAFRLPGDFDGAKEVTDDPRYNSASLAYDGLPTA